MTTSHFRNRGLRVVVDTTEPAEMDFALHNITSDQQERMAANLKALPNSADDRYFGDVRLREVLDGWDTAFVLGRSGNEFVVVIIGVAPAKEMETHLEALIRAGRASLPPAAQELLKGREAKE